MQPRSEHTEEEGEGIGIRIPRHFPMFEFETLNRPGNPLRGKALFRHLGESRQDQGFNLFCTRCSTALQTDGKGGGAIVIVVAATGSKILTQARFQESFVKGRRRITDKQARQQRQSQTLKAVDDITGQPANLDKGLFPG